MEKILFLTTKKNLLYQIKNLKSLMLTIIQSILENFEYQTKDNIFKSIGFVEIVDNLGNKYEFSQVYIDTKNKEIF